MDPSWTPLIGPAVVIFLFASDISSSPLALFSPPSKTTKKVTLRLECKECKTKK